MRSELSFLTASFLINAAILYSIDHNALHYEKTSPISKAQHAKSAKKGLSEPIVFEYVESPKAPARKSAAKTSHISDRDAVNQDQSADKSLVEGPPQVKTAGLADQLAQKKGVSSRPAAQASPEVRPQSKQQATPDTPRSPGDISQKDEIVVPKKEERQEQLSRKYSPASPQAHPSDAQDRITTSEMSKRASRGAQLTGMTSFEATGSGMGVYMKNLKEKIWLAWFPYLVARFPRDYRSADAVLSFKLNANGDVKIVELVENKGSPLFAAFCMESVQRAGSFGPLPHEILDLVGKDELEIKFAFHYS